MQYDGEAQHAKGLIKSMWKYIPRKFVGVSFFKTSTGEWSWSEQLFSWFNSFKRFVIDLNESPFIQSFNCISLMIFFASANRFFIFALKKLICQKLSVNISWRLMNQNI